MARSSISVCIVIIVTLICTTNGIVMDPLGNFVLDGYIAEDKIRAFGPIVLDPFEKYIVTWEVDDGTGNVTFTAVVQTTGYVGFGISNTGKKLGSDMVVMTIVGGEIVFKDYHGTTSSSPVVDVQEDWTLLSSSREDGYTTLTFTRVLDTGDSAGDVAIADEDTYLLWAFSRTNSPVFGYHGSGPEGYRGAFPINILNPVFPTSPPPTTQTETTITAEPTAEPTPDPTAEPTPEPTAEPTAEPTPEPTTEPATITAVPTISTEPTTEGPVPTFPPLSLDPFGKYTVEWSVRHEIESSVTFTVVVQTTGYVGFGISNTGKKSGSDIVVMTIVNEEIIFKDYHGTTAPAPVVDVLQDWSLLSSSREDGYTTLTFTRTLNTGDSAGDVAIADEDTYLLWAFPKSNSPVFAYHGAAAEGYRGAYKINILNPVFPTTPPPTT